MPVFSILCFVAKNEGNEEEEDDNVWEKSLKEQLMYFIVFLCLENSEIWFMCQSATSQNYTNNAHEFHVFFAHFLVRTQGNE